MTTPVLELNDVLALLEEQPLDSSALAELLDLPVHVVHKSLCAAERMHAVKRVGIRQLWARPDWQPPVAGRKGGRPAWVDHEARRRIILATLVNGPVSIHTIAAALGLGGPATSEECRLVTKTGAIKVVTRGGLQPRKMWALANWTPPPEQPKPATRQAAWPDDRHTERVIVQEAPDDAIDEDRPEPLRVETAHGTKLRQVDPKATIPKDASPSWWCTAPADGFTSEALKHQERMRATKEHFQVGLRLLQ